jgi:hypothetical protein
MYKDHGREQCLIISATPEVEIRRIKVQSQHRPKVSEFPHLKLGVVAQTRWEA